MTQESIETQLNTLPASPGVYLFKDSGGAVIYIGKAVSLRDRVRSYFTSAPDVRISRMVSEAASIDYILTDSEKDAFFLESNFVRQHKPKYNLRLKDDRNFPYVRITASDRFPAVRFSRRVEADGSRYFGPFSPGGRARTSIQMVNKFFKLRGCEDAVFRTRKRPCLDHEVGLCSAPCAGLISEEAYRADVENACLFLEGRTRELAGIIKQRMEKASADEEFEEAAALRDLLTVISDFREKPVTISVGLEERDALGIHREFQRTAFCIFQISGGRIIGSRDAVFDIGPDRGEDQALVDFLSGVYRDPDAAPRLVSPYGKEETERLNGELDAAGSAARLVPVRKVREKGLVGLASRNARAVLEKRSADIGTSGPECLQAVLEMGAVPRVIEGFDISNTQGEGTVASMVVFRDGKPDKGSYRKFRIKSFEGPNDFAAMAEVIGRRYGRALDEKAALPDLVLVDGGRGQLSSALGALIDLGLGALPIMSLAKKEEMIFTPDRPEGIRLARTSPALKLVQFVRDEAHRFAITFHRGLRDKKTLSSVLDGVPGVGPATRAKLLARFGGLEGLLTAGRDELAECAGEKIAGSIIEGLHPDRNAGTPDMDESNDKKE